MKKVILSIEGMTCSACSNGLEKYLNKQDKIKKASVNLVLKTASIEYDDSLTIEDLNEFVNQAGFKSLGIANLEEDKTPSKVPLFLYGLIAIIILYICMSHMFNLPMINFLKMDEHPLYYTITLLVLSIPFLFYGFDILKSGIKNLIHKMPNMDTLVSIGVLSSLIYSIYSTIMIINGHNSYTKNLYFESIAFVIYFIKLGRFITSNAHLETTEAIKKLVTVTPKYAKIKTKNGIKEITIDEVKKDDILICLAGDTFAVDGIVTSGATHVDESFITGESLPVKKSKDDKVIAGSINYDGVVEYKAERIGKDSLISEIVSLVVEATNTKAPISYLADKICSYFVPIIIVISLLTLVISLILNVPFNESLTRFVSILVIACPCALGLATPLAITISCGECAKDGILIKTSASLETMNKVNTIVFDKTGTLTNGNLTISEIHNFSKYDDEELLSILGTLENTSTHPIAKSIIKYLNDKKIKYQDITIDNIPGLGIKGKINSQEYYAGNNKILDKLKIQNNYLDLEDSLSKKGNSIIYIIENKTIIGLIGIKDTIRKEIKETINKLKQYNIDVIMLTGDNKTTANIIANELNITHVIANVLPKEKSDVIKKIKQDGKIVAMIGDGINDAPSLVEADIGISISSGTDIATSSSSIIFMNNDLSKLVTLLKISKKTILNIKENLFWASIYNICMIPLATGFFSLHINPMISSIAMITSSLIVSLNSLRLKYIKK